ncbi:MAG: O-antigen polymerase [Chitinophagaceae bacterium]
MTYDLNNILVSLIFILAHLLLFIFNFKLFGKRLMHPAILFSLLWFVVCSVHFIFSFTILDKLAPISIPTYTVFFVGTVFFSLGAFIVQTIPRKNIQSSNSNQALKITESISMTLRLLLLAIILIGLPFYIQATYRIFIASQIDDFFAGVRTAITYYEEDLGPVKYFLSLSFVVFAVNLICFLRERTMLNRVILLLCLLITLTYSVLATGRTFFLMMLTIFIGISYLLNKKFSIKKFAWLTLGFMIFFMAIGIFWGKGGDKESSMKENIPVATEITATYLVLSLNALDHEITHPIAQKTEGENTLRFFIKIGRQIGLVENKRVINLVKEFLFIPYGTNVYTYYNDYINDFGRLYAWFMLALFAALHTWMHNIAVNKKSLRYILYYSFLLYPLVMTFFQDQYMSLFSTWVQIFVYVELILLANKLFISKKW